MPEYSVIQIYLTPIKSVDIGIIINNIGKYTDYKMLSKVEIINLIGENNFNHPLNEKLNDLIKYLEKFKPATSRDFLNLWKDSYINDLRITEPKKIKNEDDNYEEKLELLFDIIVKGV